jgi:glutaconyl-CoA/methylmalonyl-CoA decarboxylase subunit gamma
MKKYVIRVNGKVYDVEVDEVREETASSIKKRTPAEAVPATRPRSTPVQPSQADLKSKPPAGSENVITAPMTGTILNIFVKSGDTVEKGDILFVLEAMKMENDVVASTHGTVSSTHVEKGSIVNAGDLLITLE